MFTFGVIAFIIGSLAFVISLFCLIIGKIMGIAGKGSAIITLVCLATAVAGIFCMGPISITRAATPPNTQTVSRSVQYDYEPGYDAVDTEDIVIPVVTEPEYESEEIVDRTTPEEQSIPVEYDWNNNVSEVVYSEAEVAPVEPEPVAAKVAGHDRYVYLPPGTLVWLSATGEKFHEQNNCGNMNPNKARQVTVEEAISRGYEACENCYP